MSHQFTLAFLKYLIYPSTIIGVSFTTNHYVIQSQLADWSTEMKEGFHQTAKDLNHIQRDVTGIRTDLERIYFTIMESVKNCAQGKN